MRLSLVALACCAAIAAPALQAQDAKPDPSIAARQAQMRLNAYNVGILGAMAKGTTPYDADKAAAAANNLVMLGSLDWSIYWVPGTDNGAMPGTRALPALFDNLEDVAAKEAAFKSAAEAAAAAAPNGQEALAAAMGGVGAACGACHQAYRAPNN